MATGQLRKAARHICNIAMLHAKQPTDSQLLDCFIEQRNEAAFAALVRRHGPVVWGVCRRVLGHHQDAEDAFQATFLVLARRAADIRPRAMVGSWLHGVAYRTALKARTASGRRRMRERQVTNMPEPQTNPPDTWQNVEPILDQELAALPDKYRIALVLCDLECKTRREVARQLKIPEGTLSSRLTTARVMLAKRLSRRGVTLSAGLLASLLSQHAAAAGVPALVVSSTITAAPLFAAGHAAALAAVSTKAAVLTQGVLKAMLLTKLKTLAGMLLLMGMVSFGGGVAVHGTVPAQQSGVRPEEKLWANPTGLMPDQRENKQTNQAAAKDLAIADFYRRIGHLGSAHFYYELVKRRYPNTEWAGEASRRVDELKEQTASANGSEPRPVQEAPQVALKNQILASQIIHYLNDNARRFQSVRFTDVEITLFAKNEVVQASGNLAAESPRRFRLSASILGKRVMDAGANDKEFWYWLNKYQYHEFYKDAASEHPLCLPPDWMVEALGLGKFGPAERYRVETEEQTLKLTEVSSWKAAGRSLRRVIVFKRTPARPPNPQILAFLLVDDSSGQEVCSARIMETQVDRPTGGVLPRKIEFCWPNSPDSLKLHLRLDGLTVNSDIPRETFERPAFE